MLGGLPLGDIGDVGGQTLRPGADIVKTTISLEGPTSRC
jgi:hypothetical protein